MSEYQYYEFQAIDRPLDDRQIGELRSLSTRATITSTSFTNEYHWGGFRGSPQRLMEEYFDAFLYLTNWEPDRSCCGCPHTYPASRPYSDTAWETPRRRRSSMTT